jgi:hypothetical protein
MLLEKGGSKWDGCNFSLLSSFSGWTQIKSSHKDCQVSAIRLSRDVWPLHGWQTAGRRRRTGRSDRRQLYRVSLGAYGRQGETHSTIPTHTSKEREREIPAEEQLCIMRRPIERNRIFYLYLIGRRSANSVSLANEFVHCQSVCLFLLRPL